MELAGEMTLTGTGRGQEGGLGDELHFPFCTVWDGSVNSVGREIPPPQSIEDAT